MTPHEAAAEYVLLHPLELTAEQVEAAARILATVTTEEAA